MKPDPASFLELRGISKSYHTEAALLETTLSVDKKERVAIVGETGSGKSTLLKIIAGLESTSHGQVLFKGERLKGPDEKLIAGHSEIAYLSQHFDLPKFITVLEYLSDRFHIDQEVAEQIYEACKITTLLEKDTRSLSGGERQRVALCKQLLRSPDLLLLDEPYSNLDLNHKVLMREVINEIAQDLATTLMMVTHDPRDVLAWATRVLVFRKGALVQEDSPKNVYKYPKNEYVAGIFGSYSLLTPGLWGIQHHQSGSQLHIIDDKIFVRPNQVDFEGASSINGKVKEVRFQGNYEEVVVAKDGEELILHVPVNKYQVGNDVMLSFITGDSKEV